MIAPNIGFGIRGKFKHFGHDCSVHLGAATVTSFSPNFFILDEAFPFVSAKGQVLYYFSENYKSIFTGISAEAIYVAGASMVLPSGDLLIGVEWKKPSGNNSFITVGVNPTLSLIDNRILPIVTLNYGFGF